MSQGYVKGYTISWDKIKAFLEITDDGDQRIDEALSRILGYVDRETHWLCSGRPMRPWPSDVKPQSSLIIAFGEDAFSPDAEELRKKDIPTPQYLAKIGEPLLLGPDVFEFVCW